jgi:predicted PurR-regulated permease PerM
LLISLGAIRASEESPGPHGANPDGETDAAAATGDGADQRGGMSKPARLDPVAFLKQFLRSNLRLLGGWLVTGIGGIVGLIGSAVICLSFVFYLLQTRSEWIDRLLRVLYFLGLRPRRDSLERVQSTITVFGGFVVMVSICGAAVIGTTAWLIGLPQPYLWGLIFGLLEFVPYFGPMVGGTLLTLVALTTGEGSWWQPVTMLMVILAWLTLEGYVIAPMVYGRAVRFDPVMVLVAILFFGWLWGPLGMVTALPVMVMLRELAVMSPETPALDALMEPQQSATSAHASH